MEGGQRVQFEGVAAGALGGLQVFLLLAAGDKPAYREACERARPEVRRIMNQWWTNETAMIQEAANRNERRALYGGQRALQSIFLSRRKRPARLGNAKSPLIPTW